MPNWKLEIFCHTTYLCIIVFIKITEKKVEEKQIQGQSDV